MQRTIGAQRFNGLLLALALVMVAFQHQSAVAAVPAAPPATSWQVGVDPADAEPDDTSGPSVRAGDVLGFGVRNLDNARIGQVQDILVNMADGQVLLVTMRYSGGLFRSDKIYPVPPSAFGWDATNEVLRLDLDEQALADAPGFDSDWPDLTQVGYEAEVYAYWQGLFPNLPIPAESEGVDLSGVVAKVSQIVESNVVNPAGDGLGTVADVIINVEGLRVSVVVLNFNRLTGLGQDQYVLPRTVFALDPTATNRRSPLGTLVVDMSPSNLQIGPVFSSFVDLTDPNWSERYRPWWQRMQRNTQVSVTPQSLAGTSWQLDFFGEPDNNLPVLGGLRMTVNFGLQRYAGTGGCNWYLGVYSAQPDHSLVMRTPSQTRLPCEPVGLLSQEATFIAALLNTMEYERIDDTLIGYTVRNQRALTFSLAEPIPFEGTTWVLQMMRPGTRWNPLITGTTITAQFEGDMFSGSAGCNTYTATTAAEGDAMGVEGVTATGESCAEPTWIMGQEEMFLSLLQTVTGMEQIGGSLQMLDGEGFPVLFFGAENAPVFPEPDAEDGEGAIEEQPDAEDAEGGADEQPAATIDAQAPPVAITAEESIGDAVGNRNVFLATISPDGEKLAWVTSEGRGRNQVRFLCLQTLATSERLCTESPERFATPPYQLAWSPDSKRIAFTENPLQLSNESDIWTFDVDSLTFTNHTDDGVEGFFRSADPGMFKLDYLPMWHPVDGSLYFWRVETLGNFQLTLAVYRLRPGEELPELVRDVTDDLPRLLPLFDQERFYMDGVSALAPDGSKVAVVLRALGDVGPSRDSEIWLIDLVDVTAPPRQMATMADLQRAVPDWQMLPAQPVGLSWTSGGDGVVVVAFSNDTHNPLHVFYYVDTVDGSITPVVDFSGAQDRSAMFDTPEGSNLPLRYYSPWTGSLSPAGDQLLMFNSLGGLSGVLAAPLPPDGSLPAFIHESPHWSGVSTVTRSSRSLDDTVVMSNIVFTLEVADQEQ